MSNQPHIEVFEREPKLVDQVWLKQDGKTNSHKHKRTTQVVKIFDPITKRPLCEIENPKLPLRGYTPNVKCLDLHTAMRQGEKGIDFGFDCPDLAFLKGKQLPEEVLFDLSTQPRSENKEIWSCLAQTLELRKKFNLILAQKWQKLPKDLKRI